jgi:benzoyl-CoA reductase/2-hydroxyglutaryl-CoA dehydratase subunit BcrC/BadD/HgdB
MQEELMIEKSWLTLNLFTKTQDDVEKRQYIILSELKKISAEFQHYKVYPHLSELIELYKTLNDVINRLSDLRDKFPKRIGKIDWVNKIIEHEVVFVDGTDLAAVEDLITWALPKIEKVIKEGVAIHEYVESDLSVEHVGILPNYREEGYFFVPDNQSQKLNLFRFEVSIFQSSEDRYRSLKTHFLKSLVQKRAHLSPVSIKLDLIREKKELPNPATFTFNTNLDFSFKQTILPVAKRKLMQTIYN